MMSFLQNVVLKDIWLKLFSLALAALAWFTVDVSLQNSGSAKPTLSLKTLSTATFTVPVVVMSSAEDVRSVKVNPKEVEVTVQGESKILQQVQAKDIRVFVDLTVIEAAHDDLKVRIEVSTPAGVSQVKVSPEEVQVIFPPKG